MSILTNLFLALVIVGGLALGLDGYVGARSALHEIEGLIWFLMATIAVAAMHISSAVDHAAKRIAPDPPKSPVTTTEAK